jgi:hypothetical protein
MGMKKLCPGSMDSRMCLGKPGSLCPSWERTWEVVSFTILRRTFVVLGGAMSLSKLVISSVLIAVSFVDVDYCMCKEMRESSVLVLGPGTLGLSLIEDSRKIIFEKKSEVRRFFV